MIPVSGAIEVTERRFRPFKCCPLSYLGLECGILFAKLDRTFLYLKQTIVDVADFLFEFRIRCVFGYFARRFRSAENACNHLPDGQHRVNVHDCGVYTNDQLLDLHCILQREVERLGFGFAGEVNDQALEDEAVVGG